MSSAVCSFYSFSSISPPSTIFSWDRLLFSVFIHFYRSRSENLNEQIFFLAAFAALQMSALQQWSIFLLLEYDKSQLCRRICISKSLFTSSHCWTLSFTFLQNSRGPRPPPPHNPGSDPSRWMSDDASSNSLSWHLCSGLIPVLCWNGNMKAAAEDRTPWVTAKQGWHFTRSSRKTLNLQKLLSTGV